MITPRQARALLLGAVLAATASACAGRQRQVRVLPPVLPPAAYEPAPPGQAPVAAGTAAGLEIARVAQLLLGAPYREGGALPDGFDCSGLVNYVFARHGIAVPRDVKRQASAGSPIDRRDIVPGDLVFFATTGSGPTHVGIAIGEGRFIHAPKSGDVVRTESLTSAYWTSRFVTARRVSGSEP
jgi:cell wall-associated NlpC family hydrolase